MTCVIGRVGITDETLLWNKVKRVLRERGGKAATEYLQQERVKQKVVDKMANLSIKV